MRAALYARVSTDKQAEKYGIPSQVEALRNRCLERGWSALPDADKEAFVDDGYSGSELARPALNRLREVVQKGQVDVVLAYDPDRLSRNLADLLLLESDFTKHGVKLEFITQETDTSPEGKMFFAIRGAVGQYEREKIRERSMRGLKEKARQGKVLGGSCAPFGYVYNKDKATLEDDPEKAKVLRLIFYIFANESLSLQGLASRLNHLHIPTPGGGDRWRANSLSAMLRNETYAGKLHQFRSYRVEPKFKIKALTKNRKTSTAVRPKEEWATVDVLPLVSVDLFEAVQRKLRRNAELAKRNTKTDYLLSGLLYCSQCGGRMGGHTIHGIPYYRCYHKDKPDSIPLNADGQPMPCRSPEIKTEAIEPVVWEAISRLIKDPDSLIEELHRRNDSDSETREMMERELQLCQSRLRAIPAEQRRLVEGYRKGLYADFMMREDMELIQKEERELGARRAELERQLTQRELTASQEVRIKSLVQQLSAGLDSLDFHGRQEILRLLVGKVVYDGQSIEIQTIIRTAEQLHPIRRGGLRG
jgi:site-specific DNA recombinase